MNDHKICFIMCVNDELYEEECIRCIRQLHVPENYEIEQLSVRGASSMAAGYNYAMNQSDAKYKVYLHQDTFIVNKNFIFELLNIFSDKDIGMIGMVGSPCLPSNGTMWSGTRIGKLYTVVKNNAGICLFVEADSPYQKVEAVDGFCMITQYDIEWREDLFQAWDFYDISQTMEFQKCGYQVVVPYMDEPWCIHDSGSVNLIDYFDWRDVFLSEYGRQIQERGE